MVFLIIAALTIIGGIALYVIVDPSASVPVFIVVVLLLGLGLWGDWAGYEEPVISNEYELIELIEDTNVYLIQSENGTKMYRCEIESEHDKNIKKEVIKKVGASVEVEYIDENSKPVLREYVSKPKESIWNGICTSAREHSVLFVPEAYIAK